MKRRIIFILFIGLILANAQSFGQLTQIDKKGNLISMDSVDLFSGIQTVPVKMYSKTRIIIYGVVR